MQANIDALSSVVLRQQSRKFGIEIVWRIHVSSVVRTNWSRKGVMGREPRGLRDK
jgi:hypothetical protein